MSQRHYYRETNDEPICDFCCTTGPVPWDWVLPPELRPTLDESVGLPTMTISDGDGHWGACPACDRLIQQARERPARMSALIARVLRLCPGGRDKRELLKPVLTDLYGRLVPGFVERRSTPPMEVGGPLTAEGSAEGIQLVREVRNELHEERRERS